MNFEQKINYQLNKFPIEKMKWNFESIRRFSFIEEIIILFSTVFAVQEKDC